jgi:ABC-2 type transport system permease protein
MTDLLWIFRAEMKRYYAIRWSNLGDTLSWFAFTFMMFVAIVVVLNGVSGGDLGDQARLLVMIGWITWMVAGDCMAEIPEEVTEEAETGTLEQLCLLPVPFALILWMRSVAYFLGIGLRGIVAAIVLIFFIAPLPFAPALGVLFFLSLAGAYGLGYLFAGLALVFKRVGAMTSLVFSLLILLTGAFVGLESLGWYFDVLRLAFPLTWGISLMRQVAGEGVTLASLLQGGELVGLTLHSAIYLVVGLVVFAWGYRISRQKGTLAHY